MNSNANAADINVQARTAQVIPFRFKRRDVRTLLINDQPWFVATDVADALEYPAASKMTRLLDDDEKGVHIVVTPGGSQRVLIINESGLYSAILRSRKAEAKEFKKWVTAEVLPAIRKYGRYEDTEGKFGTLIGKTIGTDGFHMLGALVKGKVAGLPAAIQRRARAKIWSQTHAAFGVRSAEDIPAELLDSARNFIAACALEGEWIEAEKSKQKDRLDIHFPTSYLLDRRPDMLDDGKHGRDSLSVGLRDLMHQFESPCEQIMHKLTEAGYDVQGAWWEIRTFRNRVEHLSRALEHINYAFEAPQNYVLDKVDRGAAA